MSDVNEIFQSVMDANLRHQQRLKKYAELVRTMRPALEELTGPGLQPGIFVGTALVFCFLGVRCKVEMLHVLKQPRSKVVFSGLIDAREKDSEWIPIAEVFQDESGDLFLTQTANTSSFQLHDPASIRQLVLAWLSKASNQMNEAHRIEYGLEDLAAEFR